MSDNATWSLRMDMSKLFKLQTLSIHPGNLSSEVYCGFHQVPW